MSAPAVQEAVAATAVRPTPYQGLVPYAVADADWFFGRNEWCEVIGDNLRAFRITVLYGTSGVGKSSVLRAGLARRLRDEARANVADVGAPRLVPVVFSAWSLDDPLAALEDAIAGAARAVAPELADDPPTGSLADVLEAWPARIDGPLLLVLDQFEEFFLYHDGPDERPEDPSLDDLGTALRRRNPAVHFLISIREDSLASLNRFKGYVPGLLDHLLRIDHLERDAAREAIVSPLERWNRLVAAPGEEVEAEPALVEAVLDEVTTGRVSIAEPGAGASAPGTGPEPGIVAPYLQLVLERLWDEERRRSETQGSGGMRLLRLQTLRDLGGAERIVRTHLDAALGALPQREQEVAGRVFRQLVTPSGTKTALRVSDLAQLSDLPADRVEPLVEHLTGDVRILRGAGEGRYEIYHDALSGPILDWSARWQERHRRRRERRRLLILGGVAAVLAGIAALITVFAIQADHAKRAAERKGRVASRALAAEAVATLPANLGSGLQFALQAAEIWPTREAEGALRAALVAPLTLLGHTDTIYSAAFSPDGRRVVTASADGTARIWNAADGRTLRILEPPPTVVVSAAFSPDGKLVVTDGSDGTARLWDAASGRSLRALKGHAGAVRDAAFSPDGKRVVTASDDGTARIWDAATGRSLHVLEGHTGAVSSAAFSPDGKLVITASDDRTARIWDAATGRNLRIFNHPDKLRTADFSPDGALALTIDGDFSAHIWDLASGRNTHSFDGVFAASFSPDGRLLVTAGSDRKSRIWDAASGRSLHTLEGHTNFISGAAFSPDGKRVATAGHDKTVRVWDVATGRSLQTFKEPNGVLAAVFAADGKRILTLSEDGKARIWEPVDVSGVPFARLLARVRERLAAVRE